MTELFTKTIEAAKLLPDEQQDALARSDCSKAIPSHGAGSVLTTNMTAN